MDIALLRLGVYSVHSQSGRTYHVDVFEGSCTCPDWEQSQPEGGCKHMRRVDLDIDAGAVPRPDGRLPTPEPAIAVLNQSQRGARPRGNSSTADAHRISGPHYEFGPGGQPTGTVYFRCDRCGREAMRRRDLREATCHTHW